MLESLITSRTRIKLLMRFFLNPNSRSYLRELANEFGESTNSVRLELNRLSEANLLVSKEEGRSRFYKANIAHPLFPEIQSIVKKTLGLDQLVEKFAAQLGDLKRVFLAGDYGKGIDSGLIDIVLIGQIDKIYLDKLVTKTESLIHRKIRTLILDEEEFIKMRQRNWRNENLVLLWTNEKS